jgi:hypothetical protein
MKLVLLKAFKSTDRGNRNLTYYLEGSRTNRYTISVIPDLFHPKVEVIGGWAPAELGMGPSGAGDIINLFFYY